MSTDPPVASPVVSAAIPVLGYTGATEALAPTGDNAHLLTQAAEKRSCIRILTRSGRWDLIWGSLCFGLAMLAYKFHLFAILLFVLGGLMLAIGCWLMIRPSPLAMIADGALLLFFAGFNSWEYFHQRAQPRPILPLTAQPGPILLLLVVFPLLAALRRFARYKRFSLAQSARISRETVVWLQEMERVLRFANPARDEAMIRFTSSRMGFKAELLPDDLAACLINARRMVFVAKRDIAIEVIGPAASKNKFKAQARLGNKTASGIIHAASLARFRKWKLEGEEEAVILEPEEA